MTIGTALRAGLVGGVVAAVVNVIVFLVGNVPDDVLTPMDQPITLGAVIFASIIAVTLGSIVLYLLRTRVRVYQIVVAIVAFLSLLQPAGIEDAPGSMLVTLFIMHLVAGEVAALVVPRLAGATDGWFLPASN